MRYVLAVLGFIAAFIILIVLIVTLRPNNNSVSRSNTPQPTLSDLASSDSVVRLTADGPIVAEEDHRSIRIMVDQSHRSIDIISGYNGKVIGTENYDNNKESYNAFLAALDRAGFTVEKKSKFDTEAGFCPTSTRYVYELYNTPNDSSYKPFRRWSLACSNTNATFGGNGSTVRTLFKAQIPNYQAFVNQTDGANTVSL